jgi:hypothetical protein
LAIKKTIRECLPKKNPLERPDYTEAEIQSLRAVHGGRADKRQQRMALDFLMRAFCKDDISFRPDDPHLTSFCEGKRWCATLVVWALKEAETNTDPDKIAARLLEEDPNARADNR